MSKKNFHILQVDVISIGGNDTYRLQPVHTARPSRNSALSVPTHLQNWVFAQKCHIYHNSFATGFPAIRFIFIGPTLACGTSVSRARAHADRLIDLCIAASLQF